MARLRYLRVRDKETGHQYDVLEEKVDRTVHEPLDEKRYPPTSRPRPPKHHVPLTSNADDERPAGGETPPAPKPARKSTPAKKAPTEGDPAV